MYVLCIQEIYFSERKILLKPMSSRLFSGDCICVINMSVVSRIDGRSGNDSADRKGLLSEWVTTHHEL